MEKNMILINYHNSLNEIDRLKHELETINANESVEKIKAIIGNKEMHVTEMILRITELTDAWRKLYRDNEDAYEKEKDNCELKTIELLK